MITFIVPPLVGPTTGGTLYNRCLTQALAQLRQPHEVLDWDRALTVVGEDVRRVAWLDSLWLERLPELRSRCSPRCTLGLLTHYLPALVSHGEHPRPDDLSEAERSALALSDAFVVPSEYLAGELFRLGVEPGRVSVIEPGVELCRAPRPPSAGSSRAVRAVVIANVTEGKGIEPFLRELAAVLDAEVGLELTIVGSTELEPECFERCRDLVSRASVLSDRVRFAGSLPPPDCIDALLDAHLLVSASRMESYGMALAEARAYGRPILAREGGNVAWHVDPRWGGELVPDAGALARALVTLLADRDELGARQIRAWAHRPARSWARAAEELRSAVRDGPPPRPPQ